MAMQVAVKDKFTLFRKGSYKFLYSEVRGVKDSTWSLPSSVEVLTTQRATVVSINDAIWVENWHNFENEMIPQCFCLRSLARKKIKDTFHHPRGITFARMNSCA